MKKQKDIKSIETVVEDGIALIGLESFAKLDAAYVAKNYYDYILIKTVEIPIYYDFSTAIARAYDALKIGGKLIIDTTGTAFDVDRFYTILNLFFSPLEEKEELYIYKKVEGK